MTEPGGVADRLEELIAAARAAREHAYAPYSGFRVGAAVLAGGRVFTGANVENASFAVTLCAERVAAGSAVAAGLHRIEAVAITGSRAEAISPCGLCRQFLSEFNPEMVVASEGESGDRSVDPLSALLPEPFGPADLA